MPTRRQVHRAMRRPVGVIAAAGLALLLADRASLASAMVKVAAPGSIVPEERLLQQDSSESAQGLSAQFAFSASLSAPMPSALGAEQQTALSPVRPPQPLVSGYPPAPAPAAPREVPVAPPFSLAQCDVESAGPVCFGSGEEQEVILPPALPAGLRGLWSFDKASVLDSSDFHNHGSGAFQPGPAFGGQGNSAFFKGSFLEVQDATGSLQLEDFTFSFWLYLIEDGTSPLGFKRCPLLRKGVGSGSEFLGGGGDAGEYGASPAILFDRSSRRLGIELLTYNAAGLEQGTAFVEAFESNARLRRGRWTHIAVVRNDHERRTRLYVNGILDSSHTSKGFIKPSHTTLFIGGDPLTKESCDMPMYLDEVKVFDHALDVDYIQAEASPALAGIEPNFVHLGCLNCPLEAAGKSCSAGRHICSSLELHMGGYQVAHALGWLEPGGHVWSHSGVDVSGIVEGAGQGSAPKGATGSTGDAGSALDTDSTQFTSSIQGADQSGMQMVVQGIPVWSNDQSPPAPMVVQGIPDKPIIALAELLAPPENSHSDDIVMENQPSVGLALCCADTS